MSETIASIERALQALLIFSADQRTIGVTQLADQLGCSTSSAQRTINSLVKLRFLRQDNHRRVYRLGAGVLQLARAWRSSASLASIAQPVIEELAHDTGLNSTFGIADHAHIRVIVAVDGPNGTIRDYPITGEMYPAHVGAISKAYYAFLDRESRQFFTTQRPLARYTAMTSVNSHLLETEFAKVRTQGYCVTRGEYDEQVSALAVPVQAGKDPLGSIAVATRNELVPSDELVGRIRSAAGALAQHLKVREQDF
ncbi:IclR family transcriptional regulator [Auritidibacter sp. NML130574]|uniref:IclR family transcriptional regulator n=1 Tax=Auritidibacter sp. NML130574 TaxID=2170745 RepID=UPI000D735A09|nr:IclR family transcriptional regulator [Auritidibacter sp. NML130574]AXR73570.1 IclR family transcriptional regulator [Auritidibacter sp. NML130574]